MLITTQLINVSSAQQADIVLNMVQESHQSVHQESIQLRSHLDVHSVQLVPIVQTWPLQTKKLSFRNAQLEFSV